jgi:cytoskeletal protein RodZ
MLKYRSHSKTIMNKLLVITVTAVIMIGLIGATMTVPQASYATKQSKQVPPEKTTVQPERQSQQPSEAPGVTTARPERQSQFNSEQQEDGNNAAIEQKDEQIRDVLQEEEDDDENNGGNEEQIEQVEIDKKAPIAISGDNAYIVWFNDQNTPNNNSELLFRSSNDSGITFADKINLSNTTTADSINAEIAADGNNVIITWWERNSTSEEPVVRISKDSGTTFGPILRLTSNGTIGE